ncbi:MAG: hypothetical protein ABW039_14495 [Sphingobium sp.]
MEQATLIERLARHLAAGDPQDWRQKVEDAASILAILKEPDAAMREAGDDRHWRAMIDAALRTRWSVAPAGNPEGAAPASGADEEGEIALTRDAVGNDRADWTHVQGKPDRLLWRDC